MGCDIHDYVEVRVDGVWNNTGDVFLSPYYRKDEPSDVPMCWVPDGEDGNKFLPSYHRAYGQACNNDCFIKNQKFCPHPYGYRNYNLFSILADVRNGYGFAGTPTGRGYIPIALPRGLPPDVSPEVKGASDGWGSDGHSHSWLTLAELEAYDWTRTTDHTGVVDLKGFEVFLKEGKPTSWCSAVSGGTVKEISKAEMTRYIRSGFPDPSLHYITRIHWQSSYADDVRHFLDETLPRLRALGAPEDVRMVFWFDN